MYIVVTQPSLPVGQALMASKKQSGPKYFAGSPSQGNHQVAATRQSRRRGTSFVICPHGGAFYAPPKLWQR